MCEKMQSPKTVESQFAYQINFITYNNLIKSCKKSLYKFLELCLAIFCIFNCIDLPLHCL